MAPTAEDLAAKPDLEQQLAEAKAENERLNDLLTDHGRQFLDALQAIENANKTLQDEKEQLLARNTALEDALEDARRMWTAEAPEDDLKARVLRLEDEKQDLLYQCEEYEAELRADVERLQADLDRATAAKVAAETSLSKALQSNKADHQQIVQLMSEEGEELRARIEKLQDDKKKLHYELASASAQLQASEAGTAKRDSAASVSAMRADHERTRDLLSDAEGHLMLLENKVKIVERKLVLADAENRFLREDLSRLREQ
jgi:predicted  nucleic acid-binding Zn-ribbon protein